MVPPLPGLGSIACKGWEAQNNRLWPERHLQLASFDLALSLELCLKSNLSDILQLYIETIRNIRNFKTMNYKSSTVWRSKKKQTKLSHSWNTIFNLQIYFGEWHVWLTIFQKIWGKRRPPQMYPIKIVKTLQLLIDWIFDVNLYPTQKKFHYPIHTRLKVKRNLPVRLWSLKVTFPEKNAATLGGISIWQSLRTTQFEDTPLQLRLLVASREDSNGSLNPSGALFCVKRGEKSREVMTY